MSWFYRQLIRPMLFTQDPEQIHNTTMRVLGWASRHAQLGEALETFLGAPDLPTRVFGLSFPNPVGLAAGMDKHGEAVPIWRLLGFGFTELGAVTWHAQPGNDKPRVFRAAADQAIVNRMGFNNPGAEAVAQALARWHDLGLWPSHPVGMNLGKSKITPLIDAAQDYARSFEVLLPYLDFFVVNVSSPNTPNLRELQDKAALDNILAALNEVQSSASAAPGFRPKPVLIKVAPDLAFEALDQVLELTQPRGVAGIIATNTTITRPPAPDTDLARVYGQAGGLSGLPLKVRSTEFIRHISKQTQGKLPIVGVGGIFNAADAWEKILAGASLVQIYTGMIFEGPSLAREIVLGLKERLNAAGLKSLSEAVGTGVRLEK